MDFGVARTLAALNAPGAVANVAKHATDPAAARKAAQQFGAMFMQNLMRQADGTPLPMVAGTGSEIVNNMFATTMSQAAMAHDRTGLIDLLLRSIEKKQHLADGGTAASDAAGQTAAGQTGTGHAAAAAARPFPLAAYWRGNGMRPLAAALATAMPGTGTPVGAMLAAMPNMNTKLAAALGVHTPPQPGGPSTTFPSGPASGGATSEQMTAFAQKLRPLLEQAGQQLGVSPKILLAQTAIETGWGRAVVGNNLFGIKAGPSWTGSQVTTGTHEYEDGQRVAIRDSFRAYPSAEASVQDFVALVSNSGRYRAALGAGADVAAYARGLLNGGWATDIDYARKLQTVAASAAVNAAFPSPPPPVQAQAQPGDPISLIPASFAVGR